MTYATQQDLYDRFGQSEIDTLADRNNDGTPDPGVIDGAIADAGDTIDSYIGARYELPLASTPPLLTRICCDLTRFELYSDAVPELVQKRHDAAIKLLQAIQSGKATLGLAEASQPVPSDAPQTDPNAPGRTFTTGSLEDFTSDWPEY